MRCTNPRQAQSPGKTADERRAEIDEFVSRLIDGKRDSPASPRRSRPSSLQGTGQITPQDEVEPSPKRLTVSISTQTEDTDETFSAQEDTAAIHETAPLKKEYITYTKGVQTEPWLDESTKTQDGSEDDDIQVRGERRRSRRDFETEEEIRQNLRKEIEEELKATFNREPAHPQSPNSQPRFPLRTLNDNEFNAVVASSEFVSFVERSSKVIERALDMDDEYDLLADYTRTSTLDDDDDDSTPYSRTNKRSHSVREPKLGLENLADLSVRRQLPYQGIRRALFQASNEHVLMFPPKPQRRGHRGHRHRHRHIIPPSRATATETATSQGPKTCFQGLHPRTTPVYHTDIQPAGSLSSRGR